jgi:hypothetical protein
MRPNRLCCVLSTAALALCVAVSSAETTEAKEVSSHSTAADSATLCVEFGEHALVSVLNYGDDTLPLPALALPEPEPQPPKKILDGHLCTLVPRETPIPSQGCVRERQGCRGVCYTGVYDESASICMPSPGDRCVGSRAPVRVLFTHVGVCKRDCSCQVLERLRRPIETTIEEWRCNI